MFKDKLSAVELLAEKWGGEIAKQGQRISCEAVPTNGFREPRRRRQRSDSVKRKVGKEKISEMETKSSYSGDEQLFSDVFRN